MKWVYLEANVLELTPELVRELIDGVILSCGVGDEQYEGYELADEGAKLEVVNAPQGFDIKFTAPSQNLEENCNYWLSPALDCLTEDDIVDWGMR